MAQFAKSTFSHASYAAFRPTYPPSLYHTVQSYHHGPKNLCIDLGTGTGVVARNLAPSFTSIIGTDPSSGMLRQARLSTPQSQYPNITYRPASAESLPFLSSESVDLVIAAQAAHWFSPSPFFAEMARILRPGGTMALFGYSDPVFVDSASATRVLYEYAYGNDEKLLGPYWQQPGRSIVQDKLRALRPPDSEWTEVERREYEPGTQGPGTGVGEKVLGWRVSIGGMMSFVRTWSAFQGWRERWPDVKSRVEGGEGDVVDEMFEAMRERESAWRGEGEGWIDREVEVEVECGSGLVLARRR